MATDADTKKSDGRIRLIMRAIISRFAPAPTGFLHLGHVVNAIYVWSFVHRLKGRILLRIEDHDRQRSRPGYERAIVDDLAWLGFVADGPMVRQSERGAIYERAIDTLRAKGLVYACSCSRTDIAAANAGLKPRATSDGDTGWPVADPDGGSPVERGFRPAPVAQGFSPAICELRYPGTCRDRGLPEAPGCSLRVRLEPSVERFDDLRHGP